MDSRSPRRLRSSISEFHRADWPYYWIARINTLYTQELERALKSVDCDVPTWRVLAILDEQGVSSMSDIAVHAVAKLSTMTKTVYRMKADDLLITFTSENDGRVTMVDLTEAGRMRLLRVKDATHGLFERSFDRLTPAKLEKLNHSLQQIFQNLSGVNSVLLDPLNAKRDPGGVAGSMK